MAARSPRGRGRRERREVSIVARRMLLLLALLPCAAATEVASPARVRAPAGGAVTLRAFTAASLRHCSWRRGGAPVQARAGRLRLLADGALQLVALRREDAGAYSCAAENDYAGFERDIELQVTDPVELPASIAGEPGAGVAGELGRPLSVRCLVYGHPAPRVVWKRHLLGRLLLVTGEKYSTSGNELLIKALDVDSLGEYTCQAYNGISRPASWTVEIRVDRLNNSSSTQQTEQDNVTVTSHPEVAVTIPFRIPERIAASSAEREELKSCGTSAHGCCPDGETAAHGPDGEGCCVNERFGCCPDNYKPAEGPHLEGCGCQFAHFGCCPDNVTIARGTNKEGCGCEYSRFGCCPDRHTEATGENFEGCRCHTYQFGCCPDGVTVAKRSNLRSTTETQSEKYSRCTDISETEQAACSLRSERGSCRNYSAYWFFDMQYGGCSLFWYGGCEGNGNRFATKAHCEDVCVRPPAKEVCQLPKVPGVCQGSYPRWYFDADYGRCAQFSFSGCLGNANNFESRELCQAHCELETNEAKCTQPQQAGTCSERQPAWSFSATENRCVPFYYSGCGGNDNRFADERSCAAACPSAFEKDRCVLPVEVGTCTDYNVKWYFEVSSKRCRQFYYGGCGGNGNNFQTEEECASGCATQPATTPRSRQELHIPAGCEDNRFFANCHLFVKGHFCHNTYYSKICCKSCVEASLLTDRH